MGNKVQQPAPQVVIPRRLWEILSAWTLTTMLRARIRAAVVFPAYQVEFIGRAYDLVTSLAPALPDDGDVSIPAEMWRYMREWPALLARTRQVPGVLSHNNWMEVQEAQQLLEEVQDDGVSATG